MTVSSAVVQGAHILIPRNLRLRSIICRGDLSVAVVWHNLLPTFPTVHLCQQQLYFQCIFLVCLHLIPFCNLPTSYNPPCIR